ncbi:hypothetical protein GGS24DRAFT_499219 [Hypoxylon argillaceum]|nr:hypothetical protein GGS24DRAFT_499219 [Hypoxylon argillaceum]
MAAFYLATSHFMIATTLAHDDPVVQQRPRAKHTTRRVSVSHGVNPINNTASVQRQFNFIAALHQAAFILEAVWNIRPPQKKAAGVLLVKASSHSDFPTKEVGETGHEADLIAGYYNWSCDLISGKVPTPVL